MLTNLVTFHDHKARQSSFEEKGLFSTGPDLSRSTQIELLQPSAVLGGPREPRLMLTILVRFHDHRARQSSFEEKGLFSTGSDMSRNAQI